MTSSVEKPSYQEHQHYVSQLHDQPPTEWQFKQHPTYNQVLEHISKDHGNQYLQQIETQFPHITFQQIRDYVNANDKYGGAVKQIFTTQSLRLLYCSASSLRYIFQALMVLEAYSHTDCTHMVELGAGYGGLCLAIQMFYPIILSTPTKTMTIQSYDMIDLPASSVLITDYLALHSEHIRIPYHVVHNSVIHTKDNYFFISHFCFSALSESEQVRYRDEVIGHCRHGMLTWQTCFGDQVECASFMLGGGKPITKCVEEIPQTAPEHVKNYYVYF
jgi:hypothetical protein